MKINKYIWLVLLVIGLLFAGAAMFTVQQSRAALVLRLGRLTTDSATGHARIYGPGLHFKWPFISESRSFDMRIQNLDVDSSRILTAEQKYVLVDYYAKWRIQNLSVYYKRTGGRSSQARLLLQQKINALLRAAFGRRTIQEVISGQRGDVMALLTKGVNETANDLGIEVTDVRIRRIDLPQAVTESVYQRMRTEREQVATMYRSQGKAQAEAIQANADADVTVRIATARTKAARVRAEGTQQAAQLYANAYGKNANFYAFYQSLRAYEHVFAQHNTVMVLNPNSRFFRYFQPKFNPTKLAG